MFLAALNAIDYHAVFESIATPMMVMASDFTIIDTNAAYLEAVGRERGHLVGRNVFEAFPSSGEALRTLKDSLQRVVSTGKPDVLPLLLYPLSTASGVMEERFWSVSHRPICDADGKVTSILQNPQDITQAQRQKLASDHGDGRADENKALGRNALDRVERIQALNVSLLAESAQLRNMFMSAPSFMCVLRGDDHRFELANHAFGVLVGERDLLGQPILQAIPEAAGQLYVGLLDKVFRTGEAFVGKQMRVEFERTPGQPMDEVFINFVFQPIFDDDGRAMGIFIDGNDVTDHVRAERSQALLVRELHHRVRNTLATVQGVMNSTARTAETIEDYQWAFSGRISSLARTHSLLTEEIQQFVSFPNLLKQEVGIYADGVTDRVVLEGPDIELPSQLAVPLGMTIHELTTNAYKHGALSAPRGRVTVTWAVMPLTNKRVLTCHWVESGGPLVSPPSKQGFGSIILTRVLAQQIGAKVSATYASTGFELTAEIPLNIERV